jgi:hypothetical protein
MKIEGDEAKEEENKAEKDTGSETEDKKVGPVITTGQFGGVLFR